MNIIKNKSFFFIVSFLMVFLISACSNGITGGSSSENKLIEPYRLALDDIMSTDIALNKDMEYISLDYNNELPLSASDKKIIEEYLRSKYNVKIYNLTYEELVKEGLNESETKLKGILLKIEKQTQSESRDNITIEVTKYRSIEGAISAEIVLSNENGQWKVSTYASTKES